MGLTREVLTLIAANRGYITSAAVAAARAFRGACRHAIHPKASGSTHAMYVKSRDETWMCSITRREDGTASARFVVCSGCVINHVDLLEEGLGMIFVMDVVVLPTANLVRIPVDRTNEPMIRSFVPGLFLDAALSLDRSNALYGRWHMDCQDGVERVDAMYVAETDHTWCCVQHGGATRLQVLRGYHLSALEAVHSDARREPPAGVVLDVP